MRGVRSPKCEMLANPGLSMSLFQIKLKEHRIRGRRKIDLVPLTVKIPLAILLTSPIELCLYFITYLIQWGWGRGGRGSKHFTILALSLSVWTAWSPGYMELAALQVLVKDLAKYNTTTLKCFSLTQSGPGSLGGVTDLSREETAPPS